MPDGDEWEITRTPNKEKDWDYPTYSREEDERYFSTSTPEDYMEYNSIDTWDNNQFQDFDLPTSPEPFPRSENGIKASIDLSQFIPNVTIQEGGYVTVLHKEKLLQISVDYLNDYGVFIKFIQEKGPWWKRLFKKNRRDIFMNITVINGNTEEIYRYKFLDCWVADLNDSTYKIRTKDNDVTHWCDIEFKYRKIEVTCLNQ